jgi:raffinose/stachyose/melibiose transport system substrate-binding protein
MLNKSFKTLKVLSAMALMAMSVGAFTAQAQTVSLTIESWRNDDLPIWEDVILPAFMAQHPDIEVTFTPSPPADYNALLNSRLEAGTAGDLITCRPFDASLELFNDGYLASLADLPGVENFGDVAKSAWITDDGTTPFCVPMASVIHGFYYNADLFEELGLAQPTTEAEFYALLDALQAAGVAPLVMGTSDQWESATVGFQNIGPNYWAGEEGRLGLIGGTAKYNEGGFLKAFEELSRWSPYLIEGHESLAYPDAQNAFTLGLGAIYPGGSWEITGFEAAADFNIGVFRPPAPEGQETCYISDHTDIGIGMNAALEGAEAEAARTFLSWIASEEFASLYSNALPGFFSLSNAEITLENPLANTFISWRSECESTIRSSYQILSRGEPNNETQLWEANARMLNGELTAQEAADLVQVGLEAWYTP